MAVIETQLGLLEMQRELVTPHAMKLRQPMFGMAPKNSMPLTCIDTLASLEQTQDDGFATRTTPTFAPDTLMQRIGRAHGQATWLRGIRGGQVHGKQAQKMPKPCLTDF